MIRSFMSLYQFVWMLESHSQQRLAWKDAEQARHARARADMLAAARARAMLVANPSGQLGDARLDDEGSLQRSGLLG